MSTRNPVTVVVPLCSTKAVTTSPDWTVGECVNNSRYFVVLVTLTVTVVSLRTGIVELVLVRVNPVDAGAGDVATVPLTRTEGITTDLASILRSLVLPVATTSSPARTLPIPGELTPGWRYLVDELTWTVQVLRPESWVIVKLVELSVLAGDVSTMPVSEVLRKPRKKPGPKPPPPPPLPLLPKPGADTGPCPRP